MGRVQQFKKSDVKKDEQIEKLKGFWDIRNPQHENNADTNEDMFWGTVLMIFNDMNRANGADAINKQTLPTHDITNRALLLKIKKLEADKKLLSFMVKNGLGEEDMFYDIAYPHEI